VQPDGLVGVDSSPAFSAVKRRTLLERSRAIANSSFVVRVTRSDSLSTYFSTKPLVGKLVSKLTCSRNLVNSVPQKENRRI